MRNWNWYVTTALAGLFFIGCGQAPPPPQPESAPPIAAATDTAPGGEPNPTAATASSPQAPVPPIDPVGKPVPAAADAPFLVLDSGGHSAPLNKVLFTPDGREVITVSEDKTIRVWDADTGETVRVLRLPIGPGAEGRLSAAGLSPDGRLLAVARRGAKANESEIYLLAVAGGGVERVLPVAAESITALAFSPDGKWLATGGDDKVMRLWDVASGKYVHETPRLQIRGRVTGLAFSPDGKRVVTSFLKSVSLFEVATGRSVTVLKSLGGPVHCVAWSPDGKTIATGGGEGAKATDDDPDTPPSAEKGAAPVKLGGYVGLYDANGTLRKRLDIPYTFVRSLTFCEEPPGLLVAGKQRYCAVVGLDGKERVKFTGRTGMVRTAAVAPGKPRAVTAGQEGSDVFLWGTGDGAVVRRLGGKGHSVHSVGWSLDGTAVGWGNAGGKPLFALTTSELNARGPLERTFSLSDLEAGPAPDATFRRAHATLGAVSLAKVGKGQVAAKRGKKTVATLRFPPVNGIGIAVTCFTLLPGDRAAVGGFHGRLALFDTGSGKILRDFQSTNQLHAIAPSPDNRYVLTGGADQTLRVWDPDRTAPLLSLFVAGNEWVAWTEEGYYAASPGGERLMGWHVNQGSDKLAVFHPAAQFRASLYRPDVIKLLLKTGSVARALEVADKARGQATALTDVAAVLPPTVVITAPDQAAVSVAEPKLEVRALAQSAGKHPITALRLLLDGRPYGGEAGLKKIAKPGGGPVRETWQLTLTPGMHQLAVQAESAVSKGLSEPVQVTLKASRGLKKVPQTPQQQRADLPSLYVLAVGISDYPGDLKLRCAHRDAEVLAKTVGTHAKDLYRQVKVDVLTNKDATRRNILKKLSELGKAMTQRDVAVLSFAGHGERNARGRFFLLPVDADPADLLSSCVDGEQVKSVLADLPGRIILLLDACHSGAVDRERTRARGALTDDLVRDLASDDYGVVVMCSAMGREFALESENVGHGYFTLALVEGLSGKAANKDGVVYLNQLDTYVTDRVRELSQGRQHPVTTRPTSIRSFPLAGASPAQ